MMNVKNISIKDYHYDLPNERIAKYPLDNRDESNLLIYNNNIIQSSVYHKIDEFLPKNSLLVFNNTKVIPARLHFKTSTEKIIEIFCLEPISDTNDVYSNMQQKGKAIWKCIIGGLAKWKEPFVTLKTSDLEIKAKVIEKINDAFSVELAWEPSDKTFSEVLQIAGAIPIPPYLKRDTEEIDLHRYQTVYAKKDGSVAAPTAGLHFTENIFNKLKQKNISTTEVTLHVGAGTFKPVKAKTMEDHDMHEEVIEVKLSTLNILLQNLNNNITAVGTTSLRTLESIYWLGFLAKQNPNVSPDKLIITQWSPYETENLISVEDSLNSLIDYLTKNKLEQLFTKTGILILPGYQFKIATSLATNFHQPESTLILLVAAFIGEDWKKVYQFALDNNYRFLSYGDGSLLFRK